MPNLFLKITAVVCVSGLAACAEYPDRIEPTYVPSITFNGASCAELAVERANLKRYVEKLVIDQQRAAETDTAAVSASLFITWPAIAALPFTKDKSAQLSTARGYYEALQKSAVKQGCPDSRAADDRYETHWKRNLGDFPPI